MSSTSPFYSVPQEKIDFYWQHGWVTLEDVIPPAELVRCASLSTPLSSLFLLLSPFLHHFLPLPFLSLFLSLLLQTRIKGLLDDMIAGRIDTRRNRADLGGHVDRVQPLTENIIQIGWPTDLTSALEENLLIQRGRTISDQLYRDGPGTWAMDMNQFLVKVAHTDTDTPLHQDQSYYIKMEDQRAANLWLALEDVTDEMGCLWFEESPLEEPAALRPHRGAGRGTGALMCDGEVRGPHLTCCPLRAGSITVHSHLTPHYAKGNTTDKTRYGYVVQTRPAASVREARVRVFFASLVRGCAFLFRFCFPPSPTGWPFPHPYQLKHKTTTFLGK